VRLRSRHRAPADRHHRHRRSHPGAPAARKGRELMARDKYRPRTFVREVVMLIVAAVWWIPFYIIAAISLQSRDQINERSLAFPLADPQWGNFAEAWEGGSQTGLGSGLWSSFLITSGSVLVVIILSSIAAYAISRHASKLNTFLYFLFVIGIVLPYLLGLI